MEIKITKNTVADHILSCEREDGSVTWSHISNFFILHDLCHYAVENTLSLKNAFFGMLAQGTDITEFELSKEERKVELTPESLFAEHLVNLLVIDHTQGRMDNLLDIFKETYNDAASNLIPVINESRLEEIRKNYAILLQKWKAIPEQETFNLIFKE